MIPVPLFDLKFLIEFAATGVATSNRRHWTIAAVRRILSVNPTQEARL
jgi:hypothetical protein